MSDPNLNLLVAVNVFGLKPFKKRVRSLGPLGFEDGWLDKDNMEIEGQLPLYCDSIADAWKVFDKMIADGWEIINSGYDKQTALWTFTFHKGQTRIPGPPCKTAPEAICRAALTALGVKA